MTLYQFLCLHLAGNIYSGQYIMPQEIGQRFFFLSLQSSCWQIVAQSLSLYIFICNNSSGVVIEEYHTSQTALTKEQFRILMWIHLGRIHRKLER